MKTRKSFLHLFIFRVASPEHARASASKLRWFASWPHRPNISHSILLSLTINTSTGKCETIPKPATATSRTHSNHTTYSWAPWEPGSTSIWWKQSAETKISNGARKPTNEQRQTVEVCRYHRHHMSTCRWHDCSKGLCPNRIGQRRAIGWDDGNSRRESRRSLRSNVA